MLKRLTQLEYSSPAHTGSFNYDTQAPNAGTLSLTGFNDTGESSTDYLTSDSTFGITVSGNETTNGTITKIEAWDGSAWQEVTSPQSIDLSGVDGEYRYRSNVADIAGNISTSSELVVTLDDTPPTIQSNGISVSGGEPRWDIQVISIRHR